jgi:adenosylmethionine-8-amino-7-oxononanoate aminotransferase
MGNIGSNRNSGSGVGRSGSFADPNAESASPDLFEWARGATGGVVPSEYPSSDASNALHPSAYSTSLLTGGSTSTSPEAGLLSTKA